MTVVGTKLQTRITAAETAGKNVTALTASLADYTAKIADAKIHADGAVSGIIALVPDQGDATVAASNKAALKAARADIKIATTDLQAARKDATSIIKAIKSFKLDASGSATTTVSH